MATSTSTRVIGADLVPPRRAGAASSRLTDRWRCVLLGALFLVAFSLACGASLGCGPPHGTIGAILGQQGDGRVFLREVPSGLGAAEAGLQEGDEILLIEGRDVRQMSEQDLHRALGGAVGDTVRLTVLRGEEVLRISVKRTEARRR